MSAVNTTITQEQVVLLDPDGTPIGTMDKAHVHTTNTPLHLAFSCYAFDPDGRILLTRRSLDKRTWPGVWTNTCCGHPAPGEAPEHAIRRRMRDELGVDIETLRPVLPDFRYRAVAPDGIVENELCPVYYAQLRSDPRPNPDLPFWDTVGETVPAAQVRDLVLQTAGITTPAPADTAYTP